MTNVLYNLLKKEKEYLEFIEIKNIIEKNEIFNEYINFDKSDLKDKDKYNRYVYLKEELFKLEEYNIYREKKAKLNYLLDNIKEDIKKELFLDIKKAS